MRRKKKRYFQRVKVTKIKIIQMAKTKMVKSYKNVGTIVNIVLDF